jgi:uncharacterized protein YecT (DUF1311 family)
MRMSKAILMLGASVWVVAAFAAHPDPADVIAKQSGIPPEEVRSTLSQCGSGNEDQTTLNFCSWRDLVVAEQRLQDQVDARGRRRPECVAPLKAKVDAWKPKRDASCKRSASKQWGNGSFLPTAIAMCEQAETEHMTREIKTMPCH